jgi:hypothetical protein
LSFSKSAFNCLLGPGDYMHLLVFNDLRVCMSRTLGMPHDQAQADAHLAVLDKKLDAYEAILSAQRYMAGDVRRLQAWFITWLRLYSLYSPDLHPRRRLPPPIRTSRRLEERPRDVVAQAQRREVRTLWLWLAALASMISAELVTEQRHRQVVYRTHSASLVVGVRGGVETTMVY